MRYTRHFSIILWLFSNLYESTTVNGRETHKRRDPLSRLMAFVCFFYARVSDRYSDRYSCKLPLAVDTKEPIFPMALELKSNAIFALCSRIEMDYDGV